MGKRFESEWLFYWVRRVQGWVDWLPECTWELLWHLLFH